MNLSTLSGPELRQLLDAARARGQAQLTYQILQEMEARRTARGRSRGLFRMRRSNGEPMALVLGDPPEDPEDDIPPMPSWVAPAREPAVTHEPPPPAPPPQVLAPKPRPKPARTPSVPPSRRRRAEPAAAPAPEVAPPPEPVRPPEPPPGPRSVWDDPPEAPPPPPVAVRPPKPRGLSRGSAVGFVVGMAGGLVLGVGASELWREAPPPAPAPAAVAAAALAPPPPAPVVPAPVAPEPAPAPVATEPAVAEVAAAPDTPPEVVGPALELPREPEPSPDEADLAEAPRDACAARSTPADRTICGDPELQRLQRELRRAYARALDAHEEKDVLRERQLAWRDARSAVSDPERLAELYEARIRRLNAATEAARRAR